MKKARDSFYVALRDRLQALNPARQVLVRGVWRPGVLVEENESFAAVAPDNVFVLRWTKATVDEQHALARTEQTCEIQYQTAGTSFCGRLGPRDAADGDGCGAAVDIATAAGTEDRLHRDAARCDGDAPVLGSAGVCACGARARPPGAQSGDHGGELRGGRRAMSTPALVMQPGLPPTMRRVRGYFAPVNRLTATPTAFDATAVAAFDPDAPPAPWMDLGWIGGFTRTSETKLNVVESGAPGTVLLQGRQSIGATVSMSFERWSKLTMALSCGAQQMNVLKAGTNPTAITATSSTATFLSTPNGAGTIQAGDMIAVDADYNGQTGYVGAGASAAYLTTRSAATFIGSGA